MFYVNIIEINTPLPAQKENNLYFITYFRDTISFDLQDNGRVYKSGYHDFYFTKVKTQSLRTSKCINSCLFYNVHCMKWFNQELSQVKKLGFE